MVATATISLGLPSNIPLNGSVKGDRSIWFGLRRPSAPAPATVAEHHGDHLRRQGFVRSARRGTPSVDGRREVVLHWCHVFDHRGVPHAHGLHVRRRHAVLLLRLTPAPHQPRRPFCERAAPTGDETMAPPLPSHAAYRRIHLDLHLTQGSLCRRMCCPAPHSDSPTHTHDQEQDHDRHHHRRHPRRQPLLP
jgi:hypothetical protein